MPIRVLKESETQYKDKISSVELCQLTGATYRQIDYWCRSGVIPTVGEPMPGSGYSRFHSPGILNHVKCLVRVSKALGKNPSPGLLKQVYDHYDNGFVDLGEMVILRWGL